MNISVQVEPDLYPATFKLYQLISYLCATVGDKHDDGMVIYLIIDFTHSLL